jgi:hypothetical protein
LKNDLESSSLYYNFTAVCKKLIQSTRLADAHILLAK